VAVGRQVAADDVAGGAVGDEDADAVGLRPGAGVVEADVVGPDPVPLRAGAVELDPGAEVGADLVALDGVAVGAQAHDDAAAAVGDSGLADGVAAHHVGGGGAAG